MSNRYDEVMEHLGWYYIDETQQDVDAKTISNFENAIGYKLPEDYREFLLKYGITGLDDEVVIYDPKCPDVLELTIDVFYGFLEDDSYDLNNIKEGFDDQLPKHILPIACASDTQLCISLGSDDFGTVSWWNPHDFPPEDLLAQFEFATSTFDEFIRNRLKLLEE